MTDPRQSVSPDYTDELFLDEWGLHWCTADTRSADEAVAFVAKFCGPFEEGVSARLVSGRIEDRGGPWFVRDDDGPLAMWEVEDA